jgi:tetratricopeptide (TPR) repeat protein
MNDMPQAHADVQRLLASYNLAPESRAFAPLADAYRAAGRLDEAVRLLETGVGRHPRYVSAFVLLGFCQRDLHQDDAAEATFARVLELDPDNLIALRYRAECARRRGVPERAVEYLRRALELDPFDREVQADLGLVTTALERETRERGVPMWAPGARVERSEQDPFAVEPPQPPAARTVPFETAVVSEPPPVPGPAASVAAMPPAAEPEPAPETAPQSGVRRAPVEPPLIDLRRVGRPEPVVEPAATPGPAPGVIEPPATARPVPDRPGWHFTRQEDRIVVAPSDAPVRGPIRSVEDRLFSAPGAFSVVPPAAPPSVPVATPPPELAAEPEFTTRTLARIYESQGYFDKALGIYDELHRKHPEDRDVADRRAALRRQLGAAAETPPPRLALPPAEAQLEPAEDEQGVAWRLLETSDPAHPEQTASRLRRVAEDARERDQARRHTIVGAPRVEPPPPPPAPRPQPVAPVPTTPSEDLGRGHQDFDRFLTYLRSLKQ